MEKAKPTVLVIGGTGKTGRRVVERLTARDVTVRSASRNGAWRFDWSQSETWGPALAGADAAYITYAPDIALPGAVEAITDLIERAKREGVRRLVLLSGRGEPEAQRAEARLMESDTACTIIRASWFMQNFSESVFRDGVAAGEVVFANGDVPEPFIDADDIADVAVSALLDDGHIGQIYEVTGPRLLTFREAVAEIAVSLARPVLYVDMSPDDYLSALRKAQLPDEIISLMSILVKEVLDGRNAYVTDGVQRAMGRPPRDFTDFARHSIASNAWDNGS
ncbi:NAD(P)H-binding protein [Oceaniovalibus sp. ACAM 378]|uniref:NAD(P)H-binding protein n=1 Tax=Oceaniovalibus sp. ACAM 378 TaxID=2599923 RepID=UPI0011D8DA71|nr:NAD(P)H-binding protein [Oceaniovalibus sp. ACAM 378]TYB86057.1 NAD(P)H-binding protein [Oceaniovalibus sp. ACAM 378]